MIVRFVWINSVSEWMMSIIMKTKITLHTTTWGAESGGRVSTLFNPPSPPPTLTFSAYFSICINSKLLLFTLPNEEKNPDVFDPPPLPSPSHYPFTTLPPIITISPLLLWPTDKLQSCVGVILGLTGYPPPFSLDHFYRNISDLIT